MKKIFNLLLLSIFLIALPGCANLQKGGVYDGDRVLYSADKSIVASYDVLHSFVKWEYDNRQFLLQWPEVKRAADVIRVNAERWIKTASTLRDAYSANPTKDSKAALESSLSVLNAAVSEAIKYLGQPNLVGGGMTNSVTR